MKYDTHIMDDVSLAKMEHTYELFRDEECLASGKVTLALIDRDGKAQPMPQWLRDIY